MLKKFSGQALIKKEARKTGRDARVLEAEEETLPIGPFTLEDVHAQVGGDVRLTLSENYHSISIGVSISIPVEANADAVQKGVEYCFEKANLFLNHEIEGARSALRQIARG